MIYLDNAATSYPKPPSVVDAVAASLRADAGSSGRGVHAGARRVSAAIEQARAEVAAFIGAPDAARVAFTAGATDSLNGAIAGILSVAPGAVVVTPLEHASVMRPLRAAQARGACTEVRSAPLDAGRRLDIDRFRAMLDDDVRLAIVSHVSNVIGVAHDVSAAAAACRERGVPLLVDATQSVGVLDLDAARFDLLAFSGHKNLCGPGGVGVLHVGEGVALPPWRVGGTGGFASDRLTHPVELPWRYEAGTPNASGIAGLAAGLAFVRERGLARVRQHHFNLTRRLLSQLVILEPHLEVLEAAPDIALVSFRLRGWSPVDVARVLDESFGIAVGAGLSCAPDAHAFLGTLPDGAVRASAGLLSTEADVDALGSALTEMAAMEVYTS